MRLESIQHLAPRLINEIGESPRYDPPRLTNRMRPNSGKYIDYALRDVDVDSTSNGLSAEMIRQRQVWPTAPRVPQRVKYPCQVDRRISMGLLL